MARPVARRVIGVSLLTALLTPVEFSGQTTSTAPRADGAADAEELITEKAASCPALDEEDVVSDDGRKVAWRCRTRDKWTVFVNGVPQGAPFDEVRSLIFSPDSQHVAFAARRDKRWTIVVDGTERPGSYADVGTPLYSADGGRMAFGAKPAKKWVLVVDGEPLAPEFDDIMTRTFSPDGQRTAFVGRRRDKFFVVVDGKESGSAEIVGGIRFSSDSRRFAFATADVKRSFGNQKAMGRTTIDGVAGQDFEGASPGLLTNLASGSLKTLITGYFREFLLDTHGVTAPVFSPDGSRVAYAARRDKDASVVILDGEPGPVFPSIVSGPVFSPDNRRVAYAISEGGAKSLVIDGANVGRGPADGTNAIDDLTFAPDGQRVAYIGISGGNAWEEGRSARARRRVYVDGVAGTEYNVTALGLLQFSPDGKHTVYVVGGVQQESRKGAFVVVNTREGKLYDAIFGRARFEDDGRRIRYTALSGRQFLSVRTRLEGPPPR